MTISITHVAKNALKFSVVQIIGAVVSLLASLYIATIILPDEYGIYGFLLLWLTYATLITSGITYAGTREMPGLLGKGEVTAAVRIQNVSLTPELIWTLIPFAAIIIASFFFTDFIYKAGLIIVAFSYLTQRITNLWRNYIFIREEFNTVAVANLIQFVAVPVLTLLLVSWLKVYALLLAPLIINIIIWIYLMKKSSINYSFVLDRKETFRLLKIGIVLQAGTVIYYVYRLMDRTIIAAMLSQEQLGLYTYAIGFVIVALTIPESFTNVLQPIFWRHAEKAKSAIEGFKDAKRISIYFALATAMLIPLIQVGYYLVVNLITVNYIGSIQIFNVLSYNLYLVAIMVIPNIILRSSIVNKQQINLLFYAIGLVICIFLNILVIRLGYGVVGVAWVTVGTQCLMTLVTYWYARRYMFTDVVEYVRFQIKLIAPLIVAFGFFFLHAYLESAFGLRDFTGISLVTQLVAWGLLISIFYRDYISPKQIKALTAQIKEDLRASKTKKSVKK
jgi:O-antigen/teichoic acid export membrane protein